MPSPLHDVLVSRIRHSGPLTAAAFIELALYHPDYGYYSTAPRRSGRRGDFITSVDTGSLFGEMLAVQFQEMWGELGCPATFDLVEAGAADGRLMRDVLDAAHALSEPFYRALRVTLVERSPQARAAHSRTLGSHVERLVRSEGDLPDRIEGIIYANELLDALPVHIVVMTAAGLREICVTVDGDRLCETIAEPSTASLAEYIERTGMSMAVGERVEVGLEAAAWIRQVALRLQRGFLVLVDYGTDAAHLSGSGGTLSAYQHHTCSTGDWLRDPGERDITTHVNLTAIRDEAERAGLRPLGATDQTYFLMSLGIVERVSDAVDAAARGRRRQATTLLLPEGLGGTQKVLVFGKSAGVPRLRGLSRERLT